MYSNQKPVKAFAIVLMLLALPSSIHSQETKRQALISSAREIITAARYCTLITITAKGHAESRTMDPLLPDEKFVVWFATNPSSKKAREIQRNPNVTVHYFDPASEAYVSLHGTARLVTDASEKRRRWKEEWSPFYPDRDTSVVLIAVTPRRMEIVNITKGIVGDAKTWQPPTVDFSQLR